MFRVHGVSPPPLLIYRIAIAVLLILLLHSYSSHRSQIQDIIMSTKNDLEKCHSNSESIFSKLKVIFEHKKKIELQGKIEKNNSERKVAEMRKSYINCQTELNIVKEKKKEITNSPMAEKLKISSKEILQLQKEEMERLQKKIKEQELGLSRREKELEDIKKELEECRWTVKQHVGALPVAFYTHNETAFFNRQHKAGEALSFNRETIKEHRGEVVPGAVLMKRLKEKEKLKEENDVHPDDRKEQDDYVNEQPDVAEQDYKEHP